MKILALFLILVALQVSCKQITHKAKDVISSQKQIVAKSKNKHQNVVTKRLLKNAVKKVNVKKNEKEQKKQHSTSKRMKKKGTKDVVLSERICVDAKQSKFMDYLAEDVYGIQTLTLEHISGEVTCDYRRDEYKSTFGCHTFGYMMMATKNANIYFPNYDKDGTYKAQAQQSGDKPIQYKIGGQYDKMAKKITLYPKEDFILASDLLEFWFTENYYKHTEEDNSGTTCFKLTAQVDDSVQQGPKEYYTTQMGSNVCIKATGTQGGALSVPKELMFVEKVLFNHRSGWVKCATGVTGNNFGCKTLGFGIFLKKGSQILGPDFTNSIYKPVNEDKSKNQVYFYKINGQEDAQVLEMIFPKETTTFQQGNDYSAIYTEVEYQRTLSDNSGETCFDVFALNNKSLVDAHNKKLEEEAAKKKAEEEAAKKKAEEEAAQKKAEEEAAKKKAEEEAAKKNDEQNNKNTEDDCKE